MPTLDEALEGERRAREPLSPALQAIADDIGQQIERIFAGKRIRVRLKRPAQPQATD